MSVIPTSEEDEVEIWGQPGQNSMASSQKKKKK